MDIHDLVYPLFALMYYAYYLRHFYSADSFVDTAMNLVGPDYKVPDFDTTTEVAETVHCEKFAVGLVID